MSRHKQIDRPVRKNLKVRQSICDQVDAALVDPLTGKPGYNEWSSLLDQLLVAWLEGKIDVQTKPFRLPLEDLINDNPTHSD